jgi:hypothetical protein
MILPNNDVCKEKKNKTGKEEGVLELHQKGAVLEEFGVGSFRMHLHDSLHNFDYNSQ